MAKRAKAAKSRRTNTANGRSTGSHRLVDDVMSLTGTLLRGRQEKGADLLEALATSARDFAGSLSEIPTFRESVDDVADRLDDLADYVQRSSLENMLSDANNFARRHPFAMLALSAGAGLIAIQYVSSGRSTKSSAAAAARRHNGAHEKGLREARS